MIFMKKIMMSLGMAVAALTSVKNTTYNNTAAAATMMKVAMLKKFKPKPKDNSDTDIDISSDLGFYRAILKKLGVKETAEKIKFFLAWRQGEGGQARNNPFNTSKDVPGDADTKYNSHGVRNYPDRQTGLEATVATLKLPFYKEILDLLRKDTVTAKELAQTHALKKWGTGKMVRKVLASGRINPPGIVA
jgi:hypothetical protein